MRITVRRKVYHGRPGFLVAWSRNAGFPERVFVEEHSSSPNTLVEVKERIRKGEPAFIIGGWEKQARRNGVDLTIP